jgi:limonene-1,2-epoxide hydrolase
MMTDSAATIERNKAIVASYWDTLYSHDWDGVASFFSDDANYVDKGLGEAHGGAHGPAEIVARLRLGLEPIQSHEHLSATFIAEGNTVVTEHGERWVFDDEVTVDHPFTSVMELDDAGKIVRWWDYSNIDRLVSQGPQWWVEHIMAGWRE